MAVDAADRPEAAVSGTGDAVRVAGSLLVSCGLFTFSKHPRITRKHFTVITRR